MIRLYYSNRTERLLDALIANREAERLRPGGALRPFTLVVPNKNVETYVKFGLAKATGIAAGIQTSFLRALLRDVAERAVPGAEVIEGPRLLGMVLGVLHDEAALAHPELASVREYLGDGRRDAVDLRRAPLAAQRARLYEEYGDSRPEMLDAWPRGPCLDHTELAATERWQRRLWLAMAAGRGELCDTAPRLIERAGRALAAALPPAIHVFGISYVAQAFRRLWAEVAKHTALYIYTVNPCAEFWEDVATGRESAQRNLPRHGERVGDARLLTDEDPFAIAAERDTPALSMWGRPGREHVRLLNELTECEFNAPFEDPGSDTLLRALQQSIMRRDALPSEPPAPPRAPDDSIRVIACAGVRREAEAIAGEVWRLVEASRGSATERPLRFNEIAVIVPGTDQAVYQTHLAAAFRETYEIPHNIVDLPAAAESRVSEAAMAMLALPLSQLTRHDVLAVVTHPAVAARFPDADVDAWIRRCDALGIVHGADHADHAGTYIQKDVLNWDQGLRRLALGAFMTGRKSGDERGFDHAGQRYLPEQLPPGDGDGLAGFAALTRSLLADAKFARDAVMPIEQWIAFLHGMLRTYLAPEPDAPVDDERAFVRALSRVQNLAELGLGAAPVSYRIPYEVVKAELGRMSGSRGQHLADGVVVSSFVPMRAIPYRVLFVAGMGEGKFPAPDRPSQLDLRSARRRAGDVAPRDRDKYMFLETLLCARDRLILSYIARESTTGERLEPSPVVLELRHMLEQGWLGRGGFAALIETRPLRRHDEILASAEAGRGEPWLPPAAQREADAAVLGSRLRAQFGRVPDVRRLESVLGAEQAPVLAARLGVIAPPAEAPERKDKGTLSLSISTLRRFLECPLQGSAKVVVGLRDQDDDREMIEREDETFESEALDRTVLLRNVFVAALAACPPTGDHADDEAQARRALVAAYETRAALLEADGKAPTGVFAKSEKARDLRVLTEWWRSLQADGFLPSVPRTVLIGRAEPHQVIGARPDGDELVDPIMISVPVGDRIVPVELYGRTEALLPAGDGSDRSLVLLPRSKKEGKLYKYALRPFFDHVVLSAIGRVRPRHSGVFCMFEEKDASIQVHDYAPISQPEALAYLTGLLTDLLGSVHDYFLPCEVAMGSHGKAKNALGEAAYFRDENRVSSTSSQYGPVPRPERFGPPSEAETQRILDRRFGLYFDRGRLT